MLYKNSFGLKVVIFFRKMLHRRSLTGFWISICRNNTLAKENSSLNEEIVLKLSKNCFLIRFSTMSSKNCFLHFGYEFLEKKWCDKNDFVSACIHFFSFSPPSYNLSKRNFAETFTSLFGQRNFQFLQIYSHWLKNISIFYSEILQLNSCIVKIMSSEMLSSRFS